MTTSKEELWGTRPQWTYWIKFTDGTGWISTAYGISEAIRKARKECKNNRVYSAEEIPA